MDKILTKKEYETLIRCTTIASFMYGLMGDFCDEKYKKVSKQIDGLENTLLKYAQKYGLKKYVESFDDQLVTSENLHGKYWPDLEDYEDYVFWSELSTRLAMEQMFQDIGPEKLKSLDRFEIIKLRLDYEEALNNLFEKYGLDTITLAKKIQLKKSK